MHALFAIKYDNTDAVNPIFPQHKFIYKVNGANCYHKDLLFFNFQRETIILLILCDHVRPEVITSGTQMVSSSSVENHKQMYQTATFHIPENSNLQF
jgi:hypothetical protein